jgi:RimJ/RimL family protein N-acetyltransferase
MAVVVRPVRADEADDLFGLRLRALASDPDAFDQTVQDAQERGAGPLAEMVASSVADRDLVLVAADGGGLVGLVLVTHSRRPRSQHRARLWGMWVAPEARRGGVGGELVGGAVDWCRGRGIEMVDLWVVTDHVGAIRVYERAGFRVCGTARDGMRWQGRPQDEHQMTLHLPGPDGVLTVDERPGALRGQPA